VAFRTILFQKKTAWNLIDEQINKPKEDIKA